VAFRGARGQVWREFSSFHLAKELHCFLPEALQALPFARYLQGGSLCVPCLHVHHVPSSSIACSNCFIIANKKVRKKYDPGVTEEMSVSLNG
jgi:hypothetical protein